MSYRPPTFNDRVAEGLHSLALCDADQDCADGDEEREERQQEQSPQHFPKRTRPNWLLRRAPAVLEVFDTHRVEFEVLAEELDLGHELGHVLIGVHVFVDFAEILEDEELLLSGQVLVDQEHPLEVVQTHQVLVRRRRCAHVGHPLLQLRQHELHLHSLELGVCWL